MLLALFGLVLHAAHAQQKEPQLSDLEKLGQHQRTIDSSKKLRALVEEQSQQRNLACMKAFGHTGMCKCLTESLPFVFSFSDYIAITTQSKEQNSYAKLDKDMQRAYNRVGPVRDKCVRESFK